MYPEPLRRLRGGGLAGNAHHGDDAADGGGYDSPVLECYPVERAWLFGSVARKDQQRGSDVDLIVELDGDARLGLGFMDLGTDPTRALRHAVDVRTLDRQRSIRASLSNFDYERMLVYERASR